MRTPLRLLAILTLPALVLLASAARAEEEPPAGNLSIEGRVFDSDGHPVPNAAVAAIYKPSVSGFLMGIQGRFGSTDAEGRFKLEKLIPGPYAVGAEFQRGGKKRTARAELELPHTGAIELRQVDTLSLSVQVNDSRNQPVEGATVSLDPPKNHGDLKNPDAQGWSHAKTDASGRATLEDLGDVPYLLSVSATHNTRSSDTQTVMPTQGAPVITVRVEHFDVFKVRGRVVDEQGKPVAFSIGRDAYQGSFEFENEASSSNHVLRIEVPDKVPLERTYQPTHDLDLGDLVAREGLSLEVHVVDAQGKPVQGAVVGEGPKGTTNAQGIGWQTHLDAIPKSVRASVPGRATGITRDVPPDAKSVTVRIPAGATLEVSANSEANVFVVTTDCGVLNANLIQGKATLDKLTPGVCTLRVEGGMPQYDHLRHLLLADGSTTQVAFIGPKARHALVVRGARTPHAVLVYGPPEANALPKVMVRTNAMLPEIVASQQGMVIGKREGEDFHFQGLVAGQHTLLLDGPGDMARKVEIDVPDADFTFEVPAP